MVGAGRVGLLKALRYILIPSIQFVLQDARLPDGEIADLAQQGTQFIRSPAALGSQRAFLHGNALCHI